MVSLDPAVIQTRFQSWASQPSFMRLGHPGLHLLYQVGTKPHGPPWVVGRNSGDSAWEVAGTGAGTHEYSTHHMPAIVLSFQGKAHGLKLVKSMELSLVAFITTTTL